MGFESSPLMKYAYPSFPPIIENCCARFCLLYCVYCVYISMVDKIGWEILNNVFTFHLRIQLGRDCLNEKGAKGMLRRNSYAVIKVQSFYRYNTGTTPRY